MLDAVRVEASDKERLVMLKSACADVPAASEEEPHAGVPKADTKADKAENADAQEEAQESHEGLIDKPAQLEDEVDCPVCTGLSDKDCLSALDGMVTNMKPIDRLAFEKSWAGSQCSALNDDDCLTDRHGI